MRLKHIKNSEVFVENHSRVVAIDRNYNEKIDLIKLFNNSNPVEMEIGIGKGDFILEKATLNKNINYLGIEMYSSVLYRALEKYDRFENNQENVFFISGDAIYLYNLIPCSSINKLYLNFSDPWPKDRHAKRRLTSKRFLEIYSKILTKDCIIELKTDNEGLFNSTFEQIADSDFMIKNYTTDLYNEKSMLIGNIQTEYEKKFVNQNIKIYKIIIKRR